MINSSTPRRGELLTIALFALALRVFVFTIAMSFGHFSISQYTSKGDTASYLANAAAMSGERSQDSLSDYDTRVFPGYPAMIAVLHRFGIPLPAAALCVTWISAAVAAAVAGKVFGDARVGWAMTCLIPHYLINSSLGMSEAPMLAVVCLALLASQEDQLILSGILFGFAGMIRPMACFALAGLVLALVLDRKNRPVIVVLLAAGFTFAVEVLLMQKWTGDALHGIHVYANHPGAYSGHLLAWPFQSLLITPLHEATSIGRIAYIYAHVGIVLVACGLIADRMIRAGRARPRDAVACLWLIGNTAFVLCIGGVWGFRHFPRFTIPAAPALFWVLRSVLPRRPAWWWLVAGACGVTAVFGVIQSR